MYSSYYRMKCIDNSSIERKDVCMKRVSLRLYLRLADILLAWCAFIENKLFYNSLAEIDLTYNADQRVFYCTELSVFKEILYQISGAVDLMKLFLPVCCFHE